MERVIEFEGESALEARTDLINDMSINGFTVDINSEDYIDEGVEI